MFDGKQGTTAGPMAGDTDAFAADAALLAAYAAGDAVAARQLAQTHGPRAFAQAFRVLRDRAAAEDVAQEAMLRLWRAAPGWKGGQARISTWLYRVVSNLAIDQLRKRRGKSLDEIDEPSDGQAGALEEMMTTLRMDALSAAIGDLPDRQAQAITLRHLEGLSNPEIAEIMDIGVEAVESLTARAKRGLAKALEGKKEELGYVD